MEWWVVAVHGGAGVHADSSLPALRVALEHACWQAAKVYVQTQRKDHKQCNIHSEATKNERDSCGSAGPRILLPPPSGISYAVEALRRAIVALEDCPLLNAGTGACLACDGRVYCDASVFDASRACFGAVAAAPGIKNPISAAVSLIEPRPPLSCGRVRPLVLAGQHARNYAQQQGLETSDDPLFLTTSTARSNFERIGQEPADDIPCLPHAMDTVGACVLAYHSNNTSRFPHLPSNSSSDCEGECFACAGTSSGGIPLKHPGRVGHAAVYGASCYAFCPPAQASSSPSLPVSSRLMLSCSTSGNGEQIIHNQLAMEVVRECLHAASKEENSSHTTKKCATETGAEEKDEQEEDETFFDPHECLSRVMHSFVTRKGLHSFPLQNASQGLRHAGAILISASMGRDDHDYSRTGGCTAEEIRSNKRKRTKNKPVHSAELVFAHSTQNMVFAFLTSEMRRPRVVVSTMEESATRGASVQSGCFPL